MSLSDAAHALTMAELVGKTVSIEWIDGRRHKFFDGKIIEYDGSDGTPRRGSLGRRRREH